MYKIDQNQRVKVIYELQSICDHCGVRSFSPKTITVPLSAELANLISLDYENYVPLFWGYNKKTHQLLCRSCKSESESESTAYPQFKNLNIGDTFYEGVNSFSEHTWTKTGPTQAKAWNGESAQFRPNEIIVTSEEYKYFNRDSNDED